MSDATLNQGSCKNEDGPDRTSERGETPAGPVINGRARRIQSRLKTLKRVATNSKERPAILRRFAFDAIARVAPAVVVDKVGLRFLVPTDDKFVGRTTFSTGAYELEIVENALKIALGGDMRRLRNKVFVDIGANIGTTSIPAVVRWGASRVLAIEPALDNFQLLRCNAILNGVESQIECVQAAVTIATGTVSLEISAGCPGDHRVRVTARDGDFGEAQRRTVEVRAERLDVLLADAEILPTDIGVVWLDAQGHEGQILASAPVLPGVPMVVEYWPYGLERSEGLDLLHTIVSDRFTKVIDVRTGVILPATEVRSLAREYPGRTFTDIALIP